MHECPSDNAWKDVLISRYHRHAVLALRGTTAAKFAPQEVFSLCVLAEGATAFAPVSGVPFALGPYGMAVAPNGHVVVSSLAGGVAVGTLDAETATFTTVHQSGTDGAPGSYPHSVMVMMPGDSHLRGVGSQVAFSPSYASDGVLFATNSFSVLVSRDRGASWSVLATVRQSVDGAGNPYLGHCKLARNSARHVRCANGDPEDHEFGDSASYCLVCQDGHARNASEGTCDGSPEVRVFEPIMQPGGHP